MSLAFSPLGYALVFCGASVVIAAPPLRVCADPNNLPYSNQQKQGFENKLAEIIGKDLGSQVSYSWYPQRGAFFRKTLAAGLCDVVMGVPAGFDQAATTRPYYRSTYVFVSRRDSNLHVRSFDDPRLRHLRIGVHVLGDSNENLPPVQALISRGIVRNLVGFSIFGNLAETNPPADLIKAVSGKKVEVAVAWGPLAGYFARHSSVPLTITPIEADPAHPDLPLSFAIAIGFRRGDAVLRQRLNAEIEKRQPEIRELLQSYGVPQLDVSSSAPEE
jgi:quinoprotein dehydrogenase-associated probable ABC transporter substrate-binding protein